MPAAKLIDCACTVYIEITLNPENYVLTARASKVVYCPLHKVAPLLLKALLPFARDAWEPRSSSGLRQCPWCRAGAAWDTGKIHHETRCPVPVACAAIACAQEVPAATAPSGGQL